MKPDEFEQQLQRQPPRPIPAEWRDEILTAARRAGGHQLSTRSQQPTSWWREWFWPSPLAWAGVAAVWAVILALNTSTSSDTGASAAVRRPPASPAAIEMALAQRRELMRSLVDAAPAEAAAPPPDPARPQPHSQRRTEWSCA